MSTSLSKARQNAIRTFVAVEIPDSVRSSLAKLQAELAGFSSMLKVVNVEALHITLRFLGPVTPSRVPEVEEAVRVAAHGSDPFALDLDRLGTFPGGHRVPRVIWLGLERNAGYGSLSRLFVRLEEELVTRSFSPETREFAPHLTLARVRDGLPRVGYEGLRAAVDRLQPAFEVGPPFPVDALTVFRSDPGPTGPRYTVLARPPLMGG